MFKISIVETQGERRLVLEGRLVSPWTGEVERAWQKVGEESQNKKLVVDLTNVTLISREGEETLLRLMKEGARFLCGDVLTKHVMKQVQRRCRCQK